MRSKLSWIYGLSLAALSCAIVPAANAQARNDLNGTWTNESLTTLTRPAGLDKLVITQEEATEYISTASIVGFAPEGTPVSNYSDPEAGAPEKGGEDFGVKAYDQFWVSPGDRMAVVKGEIRSSYITAPPSGQVPYRPEVLAQRSGIERYATGIGGNEGPESPPLSERCLIGFGNTGGPGMLSTLYNNTYQFTQAPDHVAILVEMVHDVRIIPTFDTPEEARAAHKPSVITPWLGDSVGWYEDGTLVIETINIRPEQVAVSAIPISPDGVMTERLTRISDTEIFYQFEVNDPTTYSQVWKAELSFYASDEPVYEYACHEGNYAMAGILGGARLAERQEAAAAK